MAKTGFEKADAEDKYLRVSLDVLRLDTVAEFDIYLQVPSDGSYVLYRERSLPFTLEVRRRLSEADVADVYISADQGGLYRRYVEQNLSAILSDESVQMEERSQVLYSSLQGLVEDALQDPRAGDMIPRSEEAVKNTCSFLYEQKGAFEHLMRVTSYDYYTYTHSVNVFVFSIALGQRVFPRSKVGGQFGVGALLHDIGKSQIDPAIINCRGKLTPEQFEVMKLHPVYGYDILAEKGGVADMALDMVRHHHEKPNGEGYPDGLRAGQISKEAGLLKIADVFDALTTRRSYKKALSTFPALKLMRDEMAGDLDSDLFRHFVLMLGKPSA